MKKNGKINLCMKMAKTCCFRCCGYNQINSKEELTVENCNILLYPEEAENVSSKTKKDHITILSKYNKGYLAFCDKNKIIQKDCNPTNNFKPLDCQSYPFFPTIINGKLELTIDTNINRCPLFSEKKELYFHYVETLKKWQQLLPNKDIEDWIKSINLDGFEVIKYEVLEEVK